MASTASSSTPTRTTYTGPTHTYTHPQLGSLTGRLVSSKHFKESTTVQFCSIPFASVPKRFAPCEPLTTIPSDFDGRPHRNFTQFGAACPQIGGTTARWFEAYGGKLDDDHGIEFNEFTCLTMTISVPEPHLAALANGDNPPSLPILLYLYGGGAQEGVGHVDGLHSNAPLAAYAASISLPVITINIGYRLNWLGSLACQDILEEYPADPGTSPHGPFNHYIQDQRTAFSWIQKFIGGFGGDASNITAFGESAGSMLLVYHICGSTEPLFKRAILLSGVVMGHMSLQEKEAEYQGLLKQFKITGATASERLEKLRQIPAEALVQYPGAHILLVAEDAPGVKIPQPLFARGPVTYTSQMSLIQSCEWLEDIILGDDFLEGYALRESLRAVPAAGFVGVVKASLPEPQAVGLLEAYDIPTTVEAAWEMDPNLFFGNLTYVIGDIMFSAPYDMLCNMLGQHDSGKQRKIYRYAFGLSNPFPGSDHSFVTGHHFVEILFIFLTLLDRYPKHRDNWLAKQACETARRWITFAHGKQPWDEYLVDEDETQAKIAVCDDLQGWTVKTVAQDEEESKSYPWGPRRYAGWRAYHAALESLREPGVSQDVWEMKVHGARMQIFMYALMQGRVQQQAPEASDAETKRDIAVGEQLSSTLTD
ncbi:Alpha/Beta hydrolase protein [Exophiala viscosa]|uniref:Alpha/Beta hydrolase protein n=1 Tax=Exophiala viscosa TaxID=2486360 RepID=A0AAN6E285_9EURO|nr:Alpha/Beta hydrolase protein [Exophiala viscosa]KAI1629568.1 Alpha/Beta hydrolase protein [Exophiala viscosa]